MLIYLADNANCYYLYVSAVVRSSRIFFEVRQEIMVIIERAGKSGGQRNA